MKPEARQMNKLELLKEKSRQAEQGGGAARVEKQKAGGKMTARERIEFFLDDGSFEEISWEVAVEEIAAKLLQLRDTHGGHSLAFFGGGGQGNHLGGPYAKAMRSAMRTQNYYNALAQEKTGGFWVDGHLYGRQNCHASTIKCKFTCQYS